MVLLNVLTFAENFVWKDASSFRKIQKNLQELMKTNGSNEILSELWEEASQIAQMNDRTLDSPLMVGDTLIIK